MRRFLLIFWLCLAPALTFAQSSPTLIADEVVVERQGVITARGNVHIWQGDVVITAHEVRYDQSTDTLTIKGPITVQDGDRVTILASEAEMDNTLRTGVLRDARFVLDKRLQVAAAELSMESDRYNQAYKVAATSCHICNGRTPIWQIRAQRMVHDKEEQQIYFEHAQLRFFNVPVLYLPRVRLPDPSLKRSTGFLIPRLHNNTRLGVGVRLPYFITLGDHRDLTITPYISTKTNTLELRYRQATRLGDFEFNAAVSDDHFLPGSNRGYIFGQGAFALARDYDLTFELQAVSDRTYLQDYRYSDADRLRSRIELNRANRLKNVELRVSAYHSLRPTDVNSILPSIVVEGIMEERLPLAGNLGEAGYALSFFGSRRSSSNPLDTALDTDLDPDGFDLARFTLHGYWTGTRTFNNGMIFDWNTQVDADAYYIRQHATLGPQVNNATGTVMATLRWPLMRQNADGGTMQLEPVVQVAHTESTANTTPNQDSTRVELDFGNLFAASRAPGHDAKDVGTRLSFGVKARHNFANGNVLTWNIGRIFRKNSPTTFSNSSGLGSTHSDYVIEAGYTNQSGLDLMNRVILTDIGTIRKSDTRIGFSQDRTNVSATHTWLEADPAEQRFSDISELSLDGSRRIGDNWTLSTGLRYDFQSETLSEANVGAQYQNECIEVKFSATKRFTGIQDTDYGLSVGLRGFGTGPAETTHAKKCGG